MEAEIQQKFADMDRHFDELMVFLRDNMVTREDLANVKLELEQKMDSGFAKVDSELLRLENKMDDGFSSVNAELRSIKEKLADLDKRFAKLEKTSFEDNEALVQDFVLLKKRVSALEKVLEKNGLSIEI